MTQVYSNPERETDPHALPDIETFHSSDVGGLVPLEGWYWWPCFPGCLPDGEPVGPFETEQEAIEDAQSE